MATVTIDPENGTVFIVPTIPIDKGNKENQDLAVLNGKGINRLVIATIQLAIDDMKSLIKAGVVKDGKLAIESIPYKICDGMTISEVKDALMFFQDRNIGLLLHLGHINVAPRHFRKKLGFNW